MNKTDDWRLVQSDMIVRVWIRNALPESLAGGGGED